MKLSTKEMILASLFTALTAIGAFLSIPIGDVPITLQSMFVILSGLILGPKLGALSQLVYVLLGLSGVRIFAGFSGGPQTIFKPSFGFLIGFIFAAYVVGKIVHHRNSISLRRIFLATLVGTIIIYLFGVPYMYIILNNVMGKSVTFPIALKTGCAIFLPGDILKAILSSLVASKILARLRIEKI
ncbi:biotin transporter BioY [Clostridium sp. Cult2]|uniref:biotin transporter BioY n=1 Tax=Clostridium sp. Cult2 TaxID=2079003 RepID=UPI001F3DD73D|nr:biotin transporter BioY [Clostridium sp. Cult2]MCF6464480.1 BioY family transporter [Clostridium sp. Cult2]